jgi:glycosyltransferase involved in cell wall biosynthesis
VVSPAAAPARTQAAAANHKALQHKLEQVYGPIAPDQVVIAPNGVDLEQYEDLPAAPEARAALGLPEAVTVLCSGHLYAGRGVDLFRSLARRFPQASFVWVGGQPEDVAAHRTRRQRKNCTICTSPDLSASVTCRSIRPPQISCSCPMPARLLVPAAVIQPIFALR